MAAWFPLYLTLLYLLVSIVSGDVTTVKGNAIYVLDQPFYIRGVNYNPVPVGQDPNTNNDYYTIQNQGIWMRDIPLIRSMNANVIRLYGWNNQWDHTDFLDTLYNDGDNPIYVALTFWWKKVDLTGSNFNRLVTEFGDMVKKYKSHPAILMWLVGNELNSPSWYGDSLDLVMSLADAMANAAHTIDPDHPVAMPLDGTHIEDIISTYDIKLKYLDIWAAQLYRGIDFGNFFPIYSKISSKPLFMSEYGIDCLDDTTFTVNHAMQLNYSLSLWKNIVSNAPTNIGGAIFAYSDEWWKGRQGQNDSRHRNCPSNDPTEHTLCGMPMDFPDFYSNEEWYGMFSVAPAVDSVDILSPRPIYYAMQSEFALLVEPVSSKTVVGTIIAISLSVALVLIVIVVLTARYCQKQIKKSEEMMSLSSTSYYGKYSGIE